MITRLALALSLLSVTACQVVSVTVNDQSEKRPSCEEACKVCNLSTKALRERFGSTDVPKRFLFAMPYVDGESYKAYMQCIDEAVQKKTTADALGCTKRADKVCVEACNNGS